jgi:integration host factor subunit beta
MTTITKKEIIDGIAEKTKTHRDEVKLIVTAFLDSLIAEIGKGNRLEFRDFGVFEVRVRPPRQAQNPKTLAPVMVDRKPAVKFKVGRLMREALDRADLDQLVEAKPRRKKAAQVAEVKGGSSSSPAES